MPLFSVNIACFSCWFSSVVGVLFAVISIVSFDPRCIPCFGNRRIAWFPVRVFWRDASDVDTGDLGIKDLDGFGRKTQGNREDFELRVFLEIVEDEG